VGNLTTKSGALYILGQTVGRIIGRDTRGNSRGLISGTIAAFDWKVSRKPQKS
jgi:hypothetical protein